MTTNRDRAAKIIANIIRPSMREFADGIGVDLAAVLADDKLFAPDLPEGRPIGMEVRDTNITVSIDLDAASAQDLMSLTAILFDLKMNGAADFRNRHGKDI